MRAINIKWDTDSNKDVEASLPKELDIPDEIRDDEEAVSDYLSNMTGYCHEGFDLEM